MKKKDKRPCLKHPDRPELLAAVKGDLEIPMCKECCFENQTEAQLDALPWEQALVVEKPLEKVMDGLMTEIEKHLS